MERIINSILLNWVRILENVRRERASRVGLILETANLLDIIKLKLKPPKLKELQTFNLWKNSSDFDLSSKDHPKAKVQYRKIAAVFLLLKKTEKDLRVIFTRRSRNLSSHPGQISFPGGIVESNDTTIHSAALREVKEEIGLSKKNIETLGILRPHETVSNFLIHPFVGIMDGSAEFIINTGEVAELFDVPLEFLLDKNNMREHKIQMEKGNFGYYAIPYGPYYIWGATARIIRSFVERIHA